MSADAQVEPPAWVHVSILKRQARERRATAMWMLAAQATAALLTLFIWPQFNFEIAMFKEEYVHALFNNHELACGVICGTLFMGFPIFLLSMVLPSYFLEFFEKRQGLLVTNLLTIASVVMILGLINGAAEYHQAYFFAVWLGVAVASGWLAFKVSSYLRRTVRATA
jgi:hypothetical protein